MFADENIIRNKKVLLVTFSDNADHQDITFSMFEELSGDYNVWLMCIDNPKVSLRLSERVKFVKCPQRPGLSLKTFDIFSLNKALQWIKRQHFDVVFFESLHIWNLPIMMYCRRHSTVFQVIHDIIPHDGDKSAKLVRLMNRTVCRLANEIVLVNNKYAVKVTQLYGVSPEHVHCVDMWRSFPEYTYPAFSKRVLFFGRINPYKGVNNLIKIAKACDEIHFDVVGRIDPQMEIAANELSCMPNVTVMNEYVSNKEMENAFRNADWIILPYNSATQSGVIIDAYRYSRPVIAFDVGAVSEQIQDGLSGYLIEAGNCDFFAQKLSEAVNMSQEHYNDMSLYAYRYGKEKYGTEGAVNRFLQLIGLRATK